MDPTIVAALIGGGFVLLSAAIGAISVTVRARGTREDRLMSQVEAMARTDSEFLQVARDIERRLAKLEEASAILLDRRERR